MFENMTYEIILRRMLDRADQIAREQNFVIDRRTASIIFFALAPAAQELFQAYIELDQVLNESFADTQSRDFLIRRAAERGIVPEPPDPGTNAIRQGEFSMNVPIGSRFSLNRLNYVVIEKISDGVFRLQCETPGSVGNQESGNLVPVDYIDGLEWARLTDILIPGEDDEPTERLRQRYFDSLNSQAYGGNIQDYVDKVSKIQGVGGLKVYPVWNGGGTVKVVIIDSLFHPPTPTLIDYVQTAADPVPNNGLGLGFAPIGHVVTVEGVQTQEIDVSLNLTYESGWDWAAIEPFVNAAIDGYFNDLASEWDSVNWRTDPTATLIIRVSQLVTRILALAGVVDISDTRLNGDTQNVTLDVDAIPIRGAVTDG